MEVKPEHKLTALMRGVQRFVGLDEQEAVGAADGNRQVLVDLCWLDMEDHMTYTLVQLMWEQLENITQKNMNTIFKILCEDKTWSIIAVCLAVCHVWPGLWRQPGRCSGCWGSRLLEPEPCDLEPWKSSRTRRPPPPPKNQTTAATPSPLRPTSAREEL